MAWFVEIPNETKVSIGILILVVVNLAINFALAYVPWLGGLLQKYKEEIATALTALVVNALQNVLPDAYPELSVLAVQFAVALLLVLVAKVVLARNGVRAFMK